MIVGTVGTRGPLRALGASALSAALLVVACDTPPPTNVEDADPAATFVVQEVAEPGAAGSVPPREGVLSGILEKADGIDSFANARFFVDGEAVDGLPGDMDVGRIERMEVLKSEDGEPSRVSLFTVREADEPLVYVDGERFVGVYSELRPEDIEKIEVLKGESALERYGADGANGVIRITTKEAAGSVTPR